MDGATLSRVSIFKSLPEDDLVSLARLFKEERFKAGQRILPDFVEDNGECFFIVRYGSVRIHMENEEDLKDAHIADVHELGFFGEVECIDPELPQNLELQSLGCQIQVDALAVTAVEWIPRSVFIETLERHPEVSMSLLKILAEKVVHNATIIANVRFSQSLPRVARYLLKYAQTDSRGILSVRATHIQISQRIGVNRVTVTRDLGDLRDRGIVSTRKELVIIDDLDRLEAVARGRNS